MKRSSSFLLCLLLLGCGRPSSETAQAPAPQTAHHMPGDSATQVGFAPGTTSSVFEGRLEPGHDAEFVVSADRGAFLIASVVGIEEDLKVSVFRGDSGEEIQDLTPDHSFWVARVPESLGYLVLLHAPSKATDYSLTIGIPRELTFAPPPSSLDVSSQDVPANGIVSYVLPPSRKVVAELTETAKDAYLTLHHIQGTTLVKAEDGKQRFEISDPSASDLVLRFHQGRSAGGFKLNIKLE